MHTNTLAVIRAYHQAWTTKQFDTAIGLLSSALEVEVPINDYPTVVSFAEALVRFGSDVKHVELLSEMAAQDEGMLLYDLHVDWLGRMRVVEHFTVADGKIVRLRQIHDTAALRGMTQQPPSQGDDHRANDTGVKAGTTIEQIPDDRGYAAQVVINATHERVFDALTTVDDLVGWWPTTVTGSALAGGQMVLGFAGLDEEIVLRVNMADRASSVAWTCISHSALPEWTNTRMEFSLDAPVEDMTRLTFRHVGLTPALVCYSDCEGGWNHFLQSLAAYAATGKGMPFG